MLPWRGLRKIYLVGKGFLKKSWNPRNTQQLKWKLNSNTRLQARNFPRLDLGYQGKVFAKDHLNFSYRFVGEDQLTEKLSESWKNKSPLQDSSQADNRQSETIKEALGNAERGGSL